MLNALSRIRTGVVAATKRSTNHYTNSAIVPTTFDDRLEQKEQVLCFYKIRVSRELSFEFKIENVWVRQWSLFLFKNVWSAEQDKAYFSVDCISEKIRFFS